MKLGTIAKGTTDTLKLTFLPQVIMLKGGTPSALKVTVYGDGVICDLDADGLSALNAVRKNTAPSGQISIVLADGLVKGKNVEVTITESAGTEDIAVYGEASGQGQAYVQSIRQAIFANSGNDFERFAFLAIPNATESDTINITSVDGLVHQVTSTELQDMLAETQANSTIAVDNFDAMLDKVSIIPAADRTAYVVRYAPVGDLENKVQ